MGLIAFLYHGKAYDSIIGNDQCRINSSMTIVPSVCTCIKGYVYVYTSLLNQTLFADKNGWNYSQTSGVNPTITVSACTLVNFTLIDEDNLTHTLVINTGNNENTTDYTVIATVNATTNMSQGYYFFLTPGNYTYWDLYHPSTAVGTINVTNSSSGASVVYSPASASYNVQSTLYFTAKDEKTL